MNIEVDPLTRRAQSTDSEKSSNVFLVGVFRLVWEWFFDFGQYLLFQEQCRLCKRSIHPDVPGMNYASHRPPAVHNLRGHKIVSLCLCRACWLVLDSAEPRCRIYDVGENGLSLAVASSRQFDGEIKKLILKFKYDGDLLLSQDLAILAIDAWSKIDGVVEPHTALIVPVPLHSSKLRQRGFNQSELLAKHISKLLGIKFAPSALKRRKRTASQQSLGKRQRRQNVASAFAARAKLVRDKQIILVDDVRTSGATLLECASALYNNGAGLVVALTIASVDL